MTSPVAQAAEAVETVDIAVGERLALHRGDPAVKAAGKLGKLGDQEPLYALAAGLALAGIAARRPGLRRLGVRLGLAVGAADLAKSLVKRTVTRSRPNVVLDEGVYRREAGQPDRKPDQSFPSGHMACTTAALAAVGRQQPALRPLLAAAGAGLGWSRVAKGAHWPMDVAAGAGIGFLAEAASARAARALGG